MCPILGSNSISVIDGATDSISDEIPVGNNPVSLEIDNIEKSIKGLIFVVNSDSNSITVIDSTSNNILSNNITVGKNPSSIALDPITNRLYVTNKGSDSISIIDYFLSDNNKFHMTSNSTIRVGTSPTGIAINPDTNTIYVANYYDNSISIINGSAKNVDEVINVETNPSSIDIDPSSNKIYVANYGSDSISVIDGSTNTIINTIKVDKFPRGLYYNQESEILHVISSQSNTISQIKNTTLLTGITYNINPPDSGYLTCNDIKISKNDYIKYEYGSNIICKAEPKSDYIFSSWLSNLPLDTETKPITTFNSNGYGNLTANFQIPVEVTLPKEYWEQLYIVLFTVMIPAIIGWLIPSILESVNNYRQRRVMKGYISQIMSYENKIRQGNEVKQNISELEKIRLDIMSKLAEGKISESQYEILDGKISEYLENFK